VQERWPYPTSQTMQRQTGRGKKIARPDDPSIVPDGATPADGKTMPAGTGATPDSPPSSNPCQIGRQPEE
jgi:hypothetical protein